MAAPVRDTCDGSVDKAAVGTRKKTPTVCEMIMRRVPHMLKRKFLALLLLTCLVATAVAVPAQAVLSGATASVSGQTVTVTVHDDGNPTVPTSVSFAWYSGGVNVANDTESFTSSGTATSQTYTFTSVPPGTYTINVTGSGTTVTTNSFTVDPPAPTPEPVTTPTPTPEPTPTPAPVNLVITSVTLEGRNSLRVTGTGFAGGTATITTVPASPARNITIGSDGTFNTLISNMPVNTYTAVIATYFGTSPGQGADSGSFSTGGPWVVVAATTDDIEITNITAGVRSAIVEGKAKAGATVRANVGGTSGASGTGTVGADGTFRITISLAPGTYVGASVVYTTSGIGNGDASSRTFVVTDGTTPTPAPTGGGVYPTLSRGMVNAYVTTLQLYLRDLGYYTIRVDGIFGIGTETAVRNFQIMNSLPVTGIADHATQSLLYSGKAIGIGGGGGGSSGSFVTLQFGSRGTAVRNMQVRLANLGYYFGAIDGIFGSQTQAAVRQFQNRNNLAITGIANSATQSAIFSTMALPNDGASTGYVYLQFGSRGPAVVRLQTALRDAGFSPGAIDGIYGSQTVAAVKAFQRSRGLVVDGIAGRRTQNALYGTNY